MNRTSLSWKVGHTEDPSHTPSRFVPSVVPGAVQLDWANAEGWDAHWKNENFRQYEWMEKAYWVYQTVLELPKVEADQRIFFVSQGIDYQFLVKLSGQTIFGQEGMFTPIEIDITDLAKDGDVLQVVVFPAPDSGAVEKGREQANHCVKPAVAYGWDWHPRLIPLGIWDDTFLEVRNDIHFHDTSIDLLLNESLDFGQVEVAIELSQPMTGSVEWALSDPEGDVIDAQSISLSEQWMVDISSEVHNPALWWPHDHGEQKLYGVTISLHDSEGRTLDQFQRSLGFRRVRLVENEGTWEEPSQFPKTRSVPPMTLEVNGRRIFSKGSNWVPPDIFPGTINGDTYRELLLLAKDANFNLLRCWGGGIVNKEAFFQICDEIGLMVWQEFPLACNLYQDTPEYLSVLDQESQAIVKRVKLHPCLALWSGGNELFNSWSGMTDQNKALRLLNRNCFDLDPDVPFIPTSPVMGVAHGGYVFRDAEGVECLKIFQDSSNTAYTEFGCSGPSSAEEICAFMPEDEVFPPRPGGAWSSHHGFDAWDGHPGSWLCEENIHHYFGRPESIEELVEYGQILQSEGYKAIYEEARRQKPYCSMALNWCFNEAWPTAANCSVVSWPANPRPAFHAIKASCRPVMASARVSKFQWERGEWFVAELWMLNDTHNIVKGNRLEAYLQLDDEELFALAWDFDTIRANENMPGPSLKFRMKAIESQTFRLILRVESNSEWNSEYEFCFKENEFELAQPGFRPLGG